MTGAATVAPPRPAGEDPRPRWRGRLHRYAAVAALPAFAYVIALADTTTERLAVVVYALGVGTMLTVSAVYHSGRLGPTALGRMRRVDHSTILLAIGGSYTAIVGLALSGPPERRLLTVVWVAAAVGVAIRMLWLGAPRLLVAAVYVVVGWCALLEAGPLAAALDATDTTLVVLGGLLYSAGAAVYALRRPNPWPAVFGYHEVFHALVVAAVAAHYAVVVRLLTAS